MNAVHVSLLAGTLCFSSLARAQIGECSKVPHEIPAYSLKGDSATFVVSSFGNVLARPNMTIDEDDRVTVVVVTTQQEARFLRVRRVSALRTPGTINLYGSASTPNTMALERDTIDSACALRIALSDFASGRGEVEIERITNNGAAITSESLGKFDFVVNPLYTGALSFGPLVSGLRDPAFALVQKGNESIVTQTQVGDNRLIYVLMYTPFLWGKRDMDKPAKEIWHRLNPTIGLGLKDVTNNAFAGLTVDLPLGVFFTSGLHAGKVSELDPESGVRIGKAYTGSSVPTRTTWKAGLFGAVTVDLRAALSIIKAAGTTLQ